ncbi:MAG: phosphodiester glycosidase family protein [Bacteroidota bacterium]|nr:phosphodiester glycosidase family protein [Bacteroidota bacterium]
MKVLKICTIIIALLPLASLAQDFTHTHLLSDSTLQGPQNIHILELEMDILEENLEIDMASSDSILYPTSYFANINTAIAAINGGFFNIKNGGSVTFLEDEGKQVSHRSWKGDKKPDQKTNFNAALIMTKSGELKIEVIKNSTEYLASNNEEWVFTAGPMLLQNGKKSDLLEGSFITKKHPRTALCLKENSILLITVDGRHEQAKGASLPELQNFLQSQKCINAMNLDGGGSTTLWMNNEVLNCPSDNKIFDNKGERKVANIILIRKVQ